ncbi:DNA repair protein RadC [Muriicola sp.]|uniref:RadC family protein n=2 Tax=Muriicola sp. TaxID=2020856 RepID=UPI0035649607
MEKNPVSFSIKTWAEDDKPRRKLMVRGRGGLTDAELLAILIGSGNREDSALSLAKKILKKSDDSLTQLGRMSVTKLMKFRGIGEAKAVTIAAAMEISRRRREESTGELSHISGSADAFAVLEPVLSELQHEEFWILYLNNANRVIHKSQLSKGGITGTLVDVRLVLREALELGAVALILAHNHPSGALKPSEADKAITRKLKVAAEVLDIRVLDHLIVTEKAFFSFADQHLI